MDNIAFIGLGSNIGRREDNLADALGRIAGFEGTSLIAVSQAYETEPAGDAGADTPRYANAVARLRTSLRADQLLGKLQDAEVEMGRPSAAERQGQAAEPRAIDLDLLLFGDEEWHTEELVVPHPRMRGRQFVMRPLAEVGPDAVWPDGGRIGASDVAAAHDGSIVAALGPLKGFEDVTVIPDATLEGPDRGGWVEFAMLSRMRPEAKPDMDLLFAQSVLEAEGIPVLWDPHPPSRGFNPFGISPTLNLYVPSGYAERASRLLAETESADIDWPDFGDDED